MDTREVRAVIEELLQCIRITGKPPERAVAAAEMLLVRISTEPNLHALLIGLGRAIYDWEEATLSLDRYNAAAGNASGSFSVFADSARNLNPMWHHRSRVKWDAGQKVEALTQQLRDLARKKALALYNEQHPESPRA